MCIPSLNNLKALIAFSFLLLLWCSPAFGAATSYYVTQLGAGAQDGLALASAWSVADFNSSANWASSDNAAKIDPGDTVYFSGTITSTLYPQDSGSSGNYITLDGYQGGDCDPINSECTSSAEITNTTASFSLTTQDYIIIQDFRINGGGLDFLGTSSSSDSSYITIRRNEIHDIEGNGINIDYGDYFTIGGSSGNGNEIYDIGVDTSDGDISPLWTEDLVISYNHLYATKSNNDSGDRGIDGIVTHYVSRLLIEYNSIHSHNDRYGGDARGEDGIDLKRETNDVIIRFNKIYDHLGQSNITLQGGTHNAYVYGNSLHDSIWGGVVIFARNSGFVSTDNIHVWGNDIYNNAKGGINTNTSGDAVGSIYIYNNTISKTGYAHTRLDGSYHTVGDDYCAFGFNAGTVYIKNNIVYKSQYDPTDYIIGNTFGASTSRIGALEHNTYYWPSETPVWYYDGGSKTIPVMVSSYSLENDVTAGEVADPGFTNPDDNVYTLNGTNIDDGETLTTRFNVTIQGTVHNIGYDDILDPTSTYWSTTPPTVVTVKNSSYGSASDRGAYPYLGPSNPSPDGTITVSPATSVQVNSEVTLSGSANESISTWTWVIPAETFKAWDGGTTYSIADLVEDEVTAGTYWKSLQDSNTNHASEEGAWWTDAEAQQNPGTGVCDASGSYQIVLTVNDGTSDDPTPANTAIVVSSDSSPSSTTYYPEMCAIEQDNPSENDNNATADSKNTGGSSDHVTLILKDLSGEGAASVSSSKVRVHVYYVYSDTTLNLYSADDAFTDTGATWTYFTGTSAWTGDRGRDNLLASVFIASDDDETWKELESPALAAYLENLLGSGTARLALCSASEDWSTVAYDTDDAGEYEPELVIVTLNDAGTTPAIASVTCSGCDGYYTTGETIGPIYVNFSESVTVATGGGTPYLTVEDVGDSGDETLNISAQVGTSINCGSYTVAAGDSSTDFDALSITLNGGTIQATDDSTNADLTILTGATVGSLAYNNQIVIDTTDPTVSGVDGYDAVKCSTCTADGTITAVGQTVRIFIEASETIGLVTASPGFPRIELETGSTDVYAYHESFSTSYIKFIFETVAGMRTTDLDYKATSSFELGTGGSIKDPSGLTIDVTLSAPGAAGSLGNAAAIVLAVPGSFSGASYSAVKSAEGYIVANDTISITGAQTTMDLYGEPACTINGNGNTVGRAILDGQTISGFLMSN